METVIKGFKNKNGVDKYIMQPAPHTHTADEISGIETVCSECISQSLLNKMDKVPGHEGNIAILTPDGNVSAQGLSASDIVGKIDRVLNATDSNFAIFDDDGQLQDSGKNSDSFAQRNHTHTSIGTSGYQVSTGSGNGGTVLIEGNTYIDLRVGNQLMYLTSEKLANLNNVISTPDEVPTRNSTNLVTSNGIFEAIANSNEQKLTINYDRVACIDKDTLLSYNYGDENETKDYIMAHGNGYTFYTILGKFGVLDLDEDTIEEYWGFVYIGQEASTQGAVYVQVGNIKFKHTYTISNPNDEELRTINFDTTEPWEKISLT